MSTLDIPNDIADILSDYTRSKSNTNSFPKMTVRIYTCNRIVSAVCEEVKTSKIAICTKQINRICINKPTDAGVIISALQVVEPGFSVVVVAVPFVKAIISHIKSMRKMENELNFTK